MSVGIPIKLLHEAECQNVTIELKNGEVYYGHLANAEDSMNCKMTSVTLTAKDGQVTKLEHVYLRGSQIRFMVLPELLKKAPMFQRVQAMKVSQEKKKAERKGRGRAKQSARR